MQGKPIRLSRILGVDHRTVIVPIDQSVTSGPIAGLERIEDTLRHIVAGQPNAVIMHRGPATHLWKGGGTSLIVHLSAGTQLSDAPQIKTAVCNVEAALCMGADAVSVHVSLGMGVEQDSRALANLGHVANECIKWSMPLLAMMYVYNTEQQYLAESIIHAARIGEELGADLIKVNYPGSLQAIKGLISTSFVPILIAGGELEDTGQTTLKIAEEAIGAGATGVCIGRNVFQHHYPTAMVQALNAVVHDHVTADQAYHQFIHAALVREHAL